MFDCLIFDKFLKYAMSNNPDYTGKYQQAKSQVRHVMSQSNMICNVVILENKRGTKEEE